MAQLKKNNILEPKKSAPKRDRLEARVAREQKALFQKAADLQGKTLTEFLVHAAQKEALKTIEKYQIITLSKNDQQVFMEALLNYDTPNDALSSAVKLHLKSRSEDALTSAAKQSLEKIS